MSGMPAKKDNLLTGKLFRITFASFFVANIMTVLGTVIDGFVASNALDRASIAATGLVSPVIILFTVIGTIAGIGFQVRSLKCLGKGDTEGAGRALSETMITGLVLSVLLMAFALIRPDDRTEDDIDKSQGGQLHIDVQSQQSDHTHR